MYRPVAILLLSSIALAADSALEILQKNCNGCHGATAMAGLDLRSQDSALKGGARGPSVVPGKKEASLLYQAVLRAGALQMPPGRKGLTPEEIATIGAWIDAGAKWDAPPPASTAEPSWWSFKRLRRPAVPKPQSAERVRNPVDAFILERLEQKGMKPASPASRQTLVRRAYFDLHGLPPTPAEVEAFITDASPDAWEKLIDKLLASPRYGERQGRHWLDVARYADTGGFENDLHYLNAWRYRDYVIKSFNDDKPYRQFVQEQIAGDEIWPDNLDLNGIYELAPEKKAHLEARIGTGLYTVGSWFPAAGLIPDYLRAERWGDMADTTGSVFLGLTFACAKCHDHKFDPIPQKDYYRLQAVFAASEEREIPIVDIMKVIDYQKHLPRTLVMDDRKAAIQAILNGAQKRLKASGMSKVTPDAVIASLTPGEKQRREELLREIGEIYLTYPGRHPTANVLAHVEDVPDVHVLVRGDYKSKGEKVGPGAPSALGTGREFEDPPSGATQRRKDFALWLTEPDHPLTWRVMVNRIWQGHFGYGIVRTPNDFGRQGEAPSHPALLDWLATEFVQRGYSVKAMHKLIMTSSAYRMSNLFDKHNAGIDGENRLLWRMNRRRLEAEAVRDAVLAASGKLNLAMWGPPVAPPLSDEEMDGNKDDYKYPTTVNESAATRRSVYVYVKRAFRFPFFELFDAPDTTVSCARRDVTNVPPQALALLNNQFILSQARAFAERLGRESGEDREKAIARGWWLALGRPPREEEQAKALQLLSRTTTGEPGMSNLTKLALMLYNMNEFIYVD